MPLPAASDTMMVTGRLGYCACAGAPQTSTNTIAAARAMARSIVIPPSDFSCEDFDPARDVMSSLRRLTHSHLILMSARRAVSKDGQTLGAMVRDARLRRAPHH